MGVGPTPSVVLSVGARTKGRGVVYTVNELALKHGAGVETETSEPSEAYARFPKSKLIPCPAELPQAD